MKHKDWEQFLADYGVELLNLQDKYPDYETSSKAYRKAYDDEEKKLIELYAGIIRTHVGMP